MTAGEVSLPRTRLPPAERVRVRFERTYGSALARRLPTGYHRLGSVLLLRLPTELEPYFPEVGRYWQEELHVETVLRIRGPVSGTERIPQVDVIAGHATETEVVEYGVRYRLDAARLLFARGNRTERHRFGALIRPGETVVDLFAGIGYFAIPAALHGASRVIAVEKNPLAFQYLETNAQANRVSDRVEPRLGDNRTVSLPRGAADRVVLGFLPSSLPWGVLAADCVKSTGGWCHFHLVSDVRVSEGDNVEAVRRALGTGQMARARVRRVKAYGPGREHRVVDAYVTAGR